MNHKFSALMKKTNNWKSFYLTAAAKKSGHGKNYNCAIVKLFKSMSVKIVETFKVNCKTPQKKDKSGGFHSMDMVNINEERRRTYIQ